MSLTDNRNVGQFEDDDDLVAAPPSGGYGWVITFLACLNMFFVIGITFSIGTLLDTLVQVRFSMGSRHNL